MDFKLLGKRLLSVALALVMAIPFIVLTPSVTVEASGAIAPPAFTGFAPGRHTVTVNGLQARVTAWNPTDAEVGGVPARSMTVDFTGTGSVTNGRFIVYARAANGGLATLPLGGGTPEAGWLETVDNGPMTNISTSTSGTVTLTFPAAGFANNNVRLYLGAVSNRASAVGFVTAAATGGAAQDVFSINGVTINAAHTITGATSSLGYTLSGTPAQTGTYRVWFAADSVALGGADAMDLADALASQPDTMLHPAILIDLANAPRGLVPQIPGVFSLESGTAVGVAEGLWAQNMRNPGAAVVRVEFVPPAPMIPVAPDVDSFFYHINYDNDSISFGTGFTVFTQIAQLDTNNRPVVGADGSPNIIARDVPHMGLNVNGVYQGIDRRNIQVIFNRRADRIRADRGNWQIIPLSGTHDLTRNVRRGGYLGVRWTHPTTGVTELLHVIRIAERANHRDLRPYRAEIYLPSRMVGEVVQINEFIQNPSTTHTLQVRVGGDRGGAFNANRPQVATERLLPGERHYIPHDWIPRGTRGTISIAPVLPTQFLWDAPSTSANFMHIRDLYHTGSTNGYRFMGDDWQAVPLAGAIADLANGQFASQLVRFRIPNQPIAPAVGRFALLPGRNGGPAFVSRTNAHMKVLLGTDANDQQVWARLPQNNATVAQITNLFAIGSGTADAPVPFNLPVREVVIAGSGTFGQPDYVPATTREYIDLQFRFFRANRLVSLPGIWSVRADQFDGAILAAVTVGFDGGIGSSDATTVTATDATLRAAGYNITIATTNGRTNVANGAVVTDWFTNLPTGLVATVNQVQNSGATVRINITGTTTDTAARNLDIVIPASAVVDSDTPLPVTNPVNGTPIALARINIPAYGGGTPAPTVTLNPATVTIDTATPSATVAVEGTADGATTVATDLPAAVLPYVTVSVSADGDTITVAVTGTPVSAPIDNTFTVVIEREGETANLEVVIDLS
jgi:hypothetical protein